MLWTQPASLWRDFEILRREMEELLDNFTGRREVYEEFPLMNVWTNEEGAVLVAEIPGVDEKSIELSVKNNILTLKGERVAPEFKEGQQWIRQERGYGRFSRTIQLPFHVDADKCEAKYEKGLLCVTLPRADQDKVKRISVKSA